MASGVLQQRWGGTLAKTGAPKCPGSGTLLYPRFQDANFLSAVGAQVAVISVGEGNPYGHPSPELIDALADAGMLVARTDTDGSVAVVADGDDLRVVGLG